MDYSQFRFGSAHEAALWELQRAGIIGGQGAWFGVNDTGRHDLCVPNDGSIAVFGGAGSGKSASLYGTNLLLNTIGNSITFDPRGELTAISILAASLAEYEVFTFNPTGLLDFEKHGCNPLDHLTLDSPSLVADAQKAAMDICPAASIGADGKPKWWEADAQDWLTNILLYLEEQHDSAVTLQHVYELLSSIQGDVDTWCDHLGRMSASRFPSVRRFAGQIMQLQEVGRDGFTAPLSTLQTAFRFMQDSRMARAISGSDFSTRDLCDPARKLRIKVVIPIGYVDLWAPAIRLLIGSAIQHKLRDVAAPRVSVLIDECGQLGPFNSVRELYTFGRGAGLFGLCAWQEVSQLYKAFGQHGGNEIIGSAQFRVFKGLRTLDSARLVSAMAGTMTLEYDPEVEQSNAWRQERQAYERLLDTNSFIDAAADLHHYRLARSHRIKQARQLYTPDEVLNLAPSRMLAFASGLVEGVISGHWPRYFEQERLAGKYLPNPYHDPERVRLWTRKSEKSARAITEPVPAQLAHLPQYRSGTWTTIEGYRPILRRKEQTNERKRRRWPWQSAV